MKEKKKVDSLVLQNAKVLKSLRKKRGLTLYELGELSNLSPSYLSRLEASDRRLNSEIIHKLAKALACNPYDFFVNDTESYDYDKADGYKKDFPIYRVIPSGADVSNNEVAIIDKLEPMAHTFRLPNLVYADSAYAFYCVDSLNAPKYEKGDLLFVNPEKESKINDFVAIIDVKNHFFVGKLITKFDEKIQIQTIEDNKKYDFNLSLISCHPIVSVVNAG